MRSQVPNVAASPELATVVDPWSDVPRLKARSLSSVAGSTGEAQDPESHEVDHEGIAKSAFEVRGKIYSLRGQIISDVNGLPLLD